MTRRSDSGSSRSPSAVEPTTSEKTTVTIFRASGRPGLRRERRRAGEAEPGDLWVPLAARPTDGHESVYGDRRFPEPTSGLAPSPIGSSSSQAMR